jgi:hypothetical protein
MVQQIDNDILKRILRSQAWERAKGELRSILTTYYGEFEEYSRDNDIIEKFIKEMEDEHGF